MAAAVAGVVVVVVVVVVVFPSSIATVAITPADAVAAPAVSSDTYRTASCAVGE